MGVTTRGDEPDLWRGPSILVSGDDSNGRAVVAASNYRLRLARWENRWAAGSEVDVGGHVVEAHGATSLLAHPSQMTDVEVDVVCDGSEERDAVWPALEHLIPGAVLGGLQRLPPVGSVPISANQDLAVPPEWQTCGARAVDLLVTTLPSRRESRDLPVITCHRAVRVVSWHHGVLALWQPPGGAWQDDQVRWPHHGVPSRSPAWYQTASLRHRDGRQRLEQWLQDTLHHEQYHLSNWLLELERWEHQIFRELASGSSTFDELAIPELQVNLGLLAEHLDHCRRAARTWRRRREESDALRRWGGVSDAVDQFVDAQQASLASCRSHLHEAFSLFSSTAQAAQASTASTAQAQSERLNTLLTVIATAFLVPTLVAGVYGANVKEIASGTRGSLWQMLALMGLFSLGTIGLMQAASSISSGRRRAVARVLAACAFGGVVLVLVSQVFDLLVSVAAAVGVAACLVVIFHLLRRINERLFS